MGKIKRKEEKNHKNLSDKTNKNLVHKKFILETLDFLEWEVIIDLALRRNEC